MKRRPPQQIRQRRHNWQAAEGFTLTEVIVAASVLAVVMGSVSRLSIAALANSSNQSERVRIEAAINDNIQLLQMADSHLRLEDMGSQDEQDSACENPTALLAEHLSEEVPLPDAEGLSASIERKFEALDDNHADILVASYKFLAPEYKGKSTASQRVEYRTVELNPNFTAQCYTTIN